MFYSRSHPTNVQTPYKLLAFVTQGLVIRMQIKSKKCQDAGLKVVINQVAVYTAQVINLLINVTCAYMQVYLK